MERSRYTDSQILLILKQNEAGSAVPDLCRECGMSRRGNCYDNAGMESFFSILKKEKVRRHVFTAREQAKLIFSIILKFSIYRARRHQHLGNISPGAFEQKVRMCC